MLFTYVNNLYSKEYIYRTYVYSIEKKNIYYYAQHKLNRIILQNTKPKSYIVRNAFILINRQYVKYDSIYESNNNISEIIFVID